MTDDVSDNFQASDREGKFAMRDCLELYGMVENALRCVKSSIEERLDTLGLTILEFMVLDAIRVGGIDTPAKCAIHVGTSPSTMAKVLDKLEAQGYVVRRRSVYDRRFVSLHITSEGVLLGKQGGLVTEGVCETAFNKLAGNKAWLRLIAEQMSS